jgi:alpha-L-fucosidase 2
MTRRTFLAGAAAAGVAPLSSLIQNVKPNGELRLWYDRPAHEWLEALPVGNGRLGAMVFGGLSEERLQLNEGNVWGGGPHDYDSPEARGCLDEVRQMVWDGRIEEAQRLLDAKFLGRPAAQMPYQTVGSLRITFLHGDRPSAYHRELDLDAAIARTEYTVDGVKYRREVFASYPDQLLVVRLSADHPASLNLHATFDTPQKHVIGRIDDRTLTLDGVAGDAQGIPGVIHFQALVRAVAESGHVYTSADGLSVQGANAVTLLISMGSSYRSWRDASGNAAAIASRRLDRAGAVSYARLRNRHLEDYRALFHRVSLDLGRTPAAALPTDERVRRFKEGHDPQLAALHFQYGRYLLISCSRDGGQPATLQGLWNESMDPPWGSKFTVNINTEMNYWPAAPANLIECYEPLIAMLHGITVTGSRTAKNSYGARGWVTHHNTDAWRGTSPVDGSAWGMWPTGGAWLCKAIWDRYEFTGDVEGLRRDYPLIKGAAEFFLDTLQVHPKSGWLVTNPSASPENQYAPGKGLCAGPTMDTQIIHDLFGWCIRATEVLKVDAGFREEVAAARARLAPMRIGKAGQLQEWLEDLDMTAPEIHHRHVSHLYGVYPSGQINRRGTPPLWAAARRSLEIRGDEATGWSMGWKVNLWARFEDGDHAFRLISDLLTPARTAPNLFDLHPPFQIDGNFGYTAGVCEMLLQSHAGELHLLPALPTAWPSGSVRGLLARGAVTVDMEWRDHTLSAVTLTARQSGEFKIRYRDSLSSVNLDAGHPTTLLPPGHDKD